MNRQIKHTIFTYWLVICAVLLSTIFYEENTMAGDQTIPSSVKTISQERWAKLSEKRIFFGHQSVGDNIINGINELIKANNLHSLDIRKTKEPAAFNRPIFAHSYVGKNDFPESKITEFQEIMRQGIGGKVDIAFLKLCFWDIRRHTDVDALFSMYKKTFTTLRQEYPRTSFVHFTIPLMSSRDGVKEKIKRLIGISVGSDLDNMKRNQLNELILKEYSGKDPVFDIAKIESTLPDGSRSFFLQDGKKYYTLAESYTKDGGHLNESGRKAVAEQLLISLANLSTEGH